MRPCLLRVPLRSQGPAKAIHGLGVRRDGMRFNASRLFPPHPWPSAPVGVLDDAACRALRGSFSGHRSPRRMGPSAAAILAARALGQGRPQVHWQTSRCAGAVRNKALEPHELAASRTYTIP